MSVIFKMFIF